MHYDECRTTELLILSRYHLNYLVETFIGIGNQTCNMIMSWYQEPWVSGDRASSRIRNCNREVVVLVL